MVNHIHMVSNCENLRSYFDKIKVSHYNHYKEYALYEVHDC